MNRIRAFLGKLTGVPTLVGVIAGLLVSSCSQYSQKPMSVAFHNLSANYNAYFIAKANLDSAEQRMAAAYEENYNLMLPILLPMDSVLAMSSREYLEDAIKKASIVAEKHQNSKWLDNSYTLLGKARLYLGQWEDGVEALRYVFSKSEDAADKNEALTVLMRAYIERKEFANALSVSEYLREQALNSEATIEFYLTKAYLHQRTEEYLTAVAILEETLPLLGKSPRKARLHYIAGQLYDALDQYGLANKHYSRVAKNKPLYDLAFFAGMNALQNKALLHTGLTIEKVGFAKMLKDRKNADLRDKIYYTMGKVAEQKGDYLQALQYFQTSVKTPGADTKQIPYTYMEMGRIHLEQLEYYEPAKAYFDSAMALLPASEPAHKSLTERKNVLDQFVAQLTIVRTEDSLQQLAGLSPDLLEARIDGIIEADQAARKKAYEKEQAALAAANARGNEPASPVTGPRWLLYDPAQVSQGKSEFTARWGNRKLEDDWRRQNRTGRSFAGDGAVAATDSTAAGPEEVAAGFREIAKNSEEWQTLHQDMKRMIPLSDSAMTASHERKENALYSLGKIYWISFNESKKALSAFERLLHDYPQTEYRQEVYYLTYLCLPEGDPSKDLWRDRLLAEFPTSTYVRFLSQSATDKPDSPANEVYERIYELYASGQNQEAMKAVDNALPLYRDNPIADRFALLRLFIIGKLDGVEAYRTAILEFMRLYPESSYIDRTREMLAVAEQAALLPRN